MRIFDRLSHGESVQRLDGSTNSETTVFFRRLANTCVRVDADAAATHYWHSPTDDWFVEEHAFGPLHMPFPDIWLEWQTPALVTAHGEWTNSRQERIAVAFESGPCRLQAHIDKGAVSMSVGYVLIAADSGPIRHFEAMLVILSDADGLYVDHWGVGTDNLVRLVGGGDVLPMIHPALLAIGWMNCKNVSLVETVVPDAVKKRRRKRGQPEGLSYKHIKVEPPKAAKVSMSNGERVTHRQHMVRGHFKTYTEDRKLFGRYTGTYWWSWQLRGDEAVGRINHEYHVVGQAS